MKRLSIFAAVLVSFLAVFSLASELKANNKGHTANGAAYVPGELLVKYRPSVRASALERYRIDWGVSTLRSFRSIGVQHVRLPKDMAVDEALKIYRNDPEVEYAEPNYLRYEAATTPDDTFFSSLWGLHNTGQNVNGTTGTADADIDAPEAWDITTGSSSVVIAVIDSGVDYNHPDLSGNIWSNAGDPTIDGTDDDGNGYEDDVRGWDFVDDDNNPIDSSDHGTHVAGIIAAKGNNGSGITGVCWTATIMPLRILDAFGFGSVADEVAAIDYAIDKGAKIINLSLVGYFYSTTERNALSRARTAGILVVAAAGNSGVDTDTTPFYPSSYDLDNIISVAATDQDDNLASFSNYGATSVDVAAPGTNIHSAIPDRQSVWSDNFDGGNMNGWVTGGTNNTWAVTSSLSYSGSYSITDSPGGNYQNNTNSWARVPVLNLSSHSGAKLEFKLRGVSEAGYDFLYVQVSNDLASWTNKGIFIGSTVYSRLSGTSNNYWLNASVDLGAYDGNSVVYIRFLFTSDGSIIQDGWYIDDVTVTTTDTTYSGGASDYQYFQGTSMAAPFVSGLAALIKAQNPSLTNTNIKARIEDSVDSKSPLNGKVATAGRVNAYEALVYSFPAVTTGLASSVNSTSAILNGTVNPKGSPTDYYFEYGLTPSYGSTTPTGNAGSGNTNVPVNAQATISDPLATYHYRLVATNSFGTTYGQDVTFTNDTDADLMPDDWEINYFGDLSRDGTQDFDGDLLDDLPEYQAGTDPNDDDTDDDELQDGDEISHGTNPNIPDTDSDGMLDGWEVTYGLNPLDDTDANGDLDGDGVSNLDEYNAGRHPNNREPETPVLELPLDGATGVELAPTLETDSFIDNDPVPNSHEKTEWQISTQQGDFSDNMLAFKAESDMALTSLTVPSYILDENTTYYWRARFLDDGDAASEWAAPFEFTTGASGITDNNSNGIPDSQDLGPDESELDLDDNGTFDINESSDTWKCLNTEAGGGHVGVKVPLGYILNAVESVDPALISDTVNKPDILPHTLVSFSVTVPNAGDSVDITVYLSGILPANTRWYTWNAASGWQQIPATFSQTSAGDTKVVFTKTDGGAGDADGLADGVIIDPSGPGAAAVPPTQPGGNGGGGGGCFIATAAYGSPMEPHVKILRDFRDRFLLTNYLGNRFVDFYYTQSPSIADFIAKHESLRSVVRWGLLPLVGVSWFSLKIGPVAALVLLLSLLFLISATTLVFYRKMRLRKQIS